VDLSGLTANDFRAGMPALSDGGCRDLDRLDSRLRGNDESLPRQAVNPS
jgi:hypothetical protein